MAAHYNRSKYTKKYKLYSDKKSNADFVSPGQFIYIDFIYSLWILFNHAIFLELLGHRLVPKSKRLAIDVAVLVYMSNALPAAFQQH